MNELVGDTRYPIYSYHIRFSLRTPERWEAHTRDEERLPNGRSRTLISGSTMFRTERDAEALQAWLRERWRSYVEHHESPGCPPMRDLAARWLGGEIHLARRETWCCGWFDHWTFDDGRADADFVESFEAYVRRYEASQDTRPLPDDYVCLMGAEDRWRWRSQTDDGEDSTQLPCRCKHCKARGIVRIGH